MDEEAQVRHLFAGREIDPVEAASIHIALEELRDRADAFLEVEVAEDDSAARIEANCHAVASELGLRLLVTVTGTRTGQDGHGRLTREPAVLQVRVEGSPR